MSESADSGVLPAPESTSHEVMAHLKTGKCTTVELIRHYLKYLETTGRDLGAAVEILSDSALAAAQESDTRRASGKPLGCLEGVPFTAKMNIATREGTTDAASGMLRGFAASEDFFLFHQVASLPAWWNKNVEVH